MPSSRCLCQNLPRITDLDPLAMSIKWPQLNNRDFEASEFMEFRNLTPFPALAFRAVDQNDRRFHAVVIRQTFELGADGQLFFAKEQSPLVVTDEYFGEMNASSVRQESDFAPYKPATDVILFANACAPKFKPVSKFTVGLEVIGANSSTEKAKLGGASKANTPNEPDRESPVAILKKQLVVSGRRDWKRRNILLRALSLFCLPQWRLGRADVITELPLRYEYAYGGECKILDNDQAARRVPIRNRLATPTPVVQAAANGSVPATVAHVVCDLNPIGMGFAEPWFLKARKIKRIQAPQIEAYNQSWTRFAHPPAPDGFGIVARSWLPRLPRAGTYDEAWLATRHPWLPANFNFSYWNCAPADQQITPHLRGDETFVLTNLCRPNCPGSTTDESGNTKLRIGLPGHLPFVLIRFESGHLDEVPALLDTVAIDTTPGAEGECKQAMVVCVWRATVSITPEIRVIEARMIGKAEVARLRMATSSAQQKTGVANSGASIPSSNA